MAEIPLTRGYVALADDADLALLSEFSWRAAPVKGRDLVYALTAVGSRSVYMHRLVLDAPKGFYCDHINHNGLDNRRSNLRFCTSSQNAANSRKKRDAVHSQYKGVTWHASAGRWYARIVDRSLGLFESEKDAAFAHDIAAVSLRDEFACLNFPAHREDIERVVLFSRLSGVNITALGVKILHLPLRA